MPLTLNCPKCHKPFRVRDESIGGRVRCPSCGAILQVPAALSPGSSHGFDIPKNETDPAELTGAHRPVAEDFTPGGVAVNDLMVGAPGRRDGDAGAALPAPPSIKMTSMPTKPPLQIDINPPRKPIQSLFEIPNLQPEKPVAANAPTKAPVQNLTPPKMESTDSNSWKKVKSGLSCIKWGLFLLILSIICGAAHVGWILLDYERAYRAGPGLLGKEELPLWKELVIAYTTLPIALGFLLLFLGRLKCVGAPPSSETKSLAIGSLFFMILGVLGVGGIVAQQFGLLEKYQVPSQVYPIAMYIGIPCVLLTDLCTLLFIGQIGWPIGKPQLQKRVAFFIAITLLLPGIVLTAHLFYPVFNEVERSLRERGSFFNADADGDNAKRVIIWMVSLVLICTITLFRYSSVASAGSKAIRKYLQNP